MQVVVSYYKHACWWRARMTLACVLIVTWCGQVDGCDVIIVDDMIDTAGTLVSYM